MNGIANREKDSATYRSYRANTSYNDLSKRIGRSQSFKSRSGIYAGISSTRGLVSLLRWIKSPFIIDSSSRLLFRLFRKVGVIEDGVEVNARFL